MFGSAERRLRQTGYTNTSVARHGGGSRPKAVKFGGAEQRQRQTDNNSTRRRGTEWRRQTVQLPRRRRGTKWRRQAGVDEKEGGAAQNPFLHTRPCGRASLGQKKRQQVPTLLARSPERVPLQQHEDRDDRQDCWDVYQRAPGIFIPGCYIPDFQRKRLPLNGRIN